MTLPTDQPQVASHALLRGISKLLSLHDGDHGVLDVVACGPFAIPLLRRLLHEREPSGLYEPRCHVVEALAALSAEDVLVEFLVSAREFPDPVENAGEEAVLNAVARALRRPCDDRAFGLLLSLAERRRLAGAIEALGRCHNLQALPCFLAALADDLARPAAEVAIRRLGKAAISALVGAISATDSDGYGESESGQRRRRSALKALLEISTVRRIPTAQRKRLVADKDPEIALLACRALLACGADDERRDAVKRLIDLLPSPHWWFRREVEDCLLAHPDDVRRIIGAQVQTEPPNIADFSLEAEAQRALHRIAARTRGCEA